MFPELSRVMKTKYLPSGVHFPQQSCAGVIQPGSNWRASLPSVFVSHWEATSVNGSPTVNRIRLPSGEYVNPLGFPGNVANFRGDDPSDSAIIMSLPEL